MDPLPLSYASPPQQETRMTRVIRGSGQLIARGGWMLLALAIIAGIVGLAWATAGVIIERRSFWWSGGSSSSINYDATLIVGQNAACIGLIYAAVLLVIWGRWSRVRRVRRASLLLSQLRLAASLNLPLPKVLIGAAESERGRSKRQLVALHEALLNGSSIAIGLRHAAPELSPRVIELIATAEQNGTLEATLNRLLAEQADNLRRDVANFAIQRTYVMITFLMFASIMGTLMVFVVPKFAAIMHDFHVAPPTVFIAMTSYFRELWPVALALLVWVMLFITLGNAARALFVRRAATPPWRWFTDRLRWALPVSHAMARDRGLADTCDLLADGLEHGRPAMSALGMAILPTTNLVLAERLRRWHAAVALGRSLPEGAADAQLPRLIVGLLGPSHYGSAAADTLRFLARYYRDRNERLLIVLRAAFTPTAALVMGFLVMMTALMIFAPFITLIQAVSPGMQGVQP